MAIGWFEIAQVWFDYGLVLVSGIKYRILATFSVKEPGIGYPIPNFEVSVIGLRVDLKYRVLKKKTPYLTPGFDADYFKPMFGNCGIF